MLRTVAQLIEDLSEFPGDTPVCIASGHISKEFTLELLGASFIEGDEPVVTTLVLQGD